MSAPTNPPQKKFVCPSCGTSNVVVLGPVNGETVDLTGGLVVIECHHCLLLRLVPRAEKA